MTLFWITVAILIVAAALAVIPALLGRSRASETSYSEANLAVFRDRLAELAAERDRGEITPEEYEQGRAELEREVLREVPGSEDKESAPGPRTGIGGKTVVGLLVGLPVVAVSLYFATGRPQLVDEAPPTSLSEREIRSFSQMPPEQRASRLSAFLEEKPRTGEAWVLLGQTYREQGQFGEAVEAYRRARRLLGDEPQLLAHYAEAIALANDRELTGEVTELLDKALEKDPDNTLALWMAGSAAMSRGEGEEAGRLWRRLAAQMPPDNRNFEMLKGYIAQAEGISPEEVSIDRPESEASGGPAMKVRVELAGELREQTEPEDTVFIFARAAQGPPMPVAAVRKPVEELPVEVTLDDSQAMSGDRTLSSQERVVVGARISKGGQPQAQPGDLEGLTDPLSVRDGREVSVTIDQVVQ
ncbi:MAG: c-type cytochrome biogenesis protein CcmI [Thiohalorhabdus sp.]